MLCLLEILGVTSLNHSLDLHSSQGRSRVYGKMLKGPSFLKALVHAEKTLHAEIVFKQKNLFMQRLA
jgi:hypothetical protein